MNIRALVLSVLGLIGYANSVCAMDDMANQQAMVMEMIKHMPEEKVREIADGRFAEDMKLVRSDRTNNMRWAALEVALALLVFENSSESLVKKASAGFLAAFGAYEVLGALANTAVLWNLSSEKEEFYNYLMNMRAGSQMHDEALDNDMF